MQPFSITDIAKQKNVRKDIEELNNRINELDVTDTCVDLLAPTSLEITALFPKRPKLTISWSASLSKCQRIEDIQHMFSDHSGIKLEINNKRIMRKFPKMSVPHQISSMTMIKSSEAVQGKFYHCTEVRMCLTPCCENSLLESQAVGVK